MSAAKRVLLYLSLALLSYSVAAWLGGVALGAMLFVAGGLFFEGGIWMEARRSWRNRQDARHRA